MTGADAAVTVTSLRKWYGRGRTRVHALRGVDVAIPRGTFTAVMGPSGSGKSTFLQCAAGLDRPSSGSVMLGGTELTRLGERRLTVLRRERIGFVFQAYNILPALTVEQNVLLPMRLAGRGLDRAVAHEMLDRVGLAERRRDRAGELSGGQQQRVAIARALVGAPEVIFADEPTGALDAIAAAEVLALLRYEVERAGATVVMVTHDPAAAAWAGRALLLADGVVAADTTDTRPDAIAARMRGLAGRVPPVPPVPAAAGGAA